MTSTTINLEVLKALVDTTNDEFTSTVGFDMDQTSDLAIALEAIQIEEKQAKVKAAAKEIQKLLAISQEEIARKVTAIRMLRQQEQAALRQLDQINRAKAYGASTMNFLPLVSAINGDAYHQVPDSFQVAGAAKPAKKAGK